MIALLLAAAVGASPAPCRGADISVTALHLKVIKGSTSSKNATADRLLITGDFTNIGDLAQEPHTPQHAELLRDGSVVAKQPLPALAAGVTYPLQFRIFRDTSQRTDPIEVLVRYVLDDRTSHRNNCLAANDSLQKVY
jgi:hypothetical protein